MYKGRFEAIVSWSSLWRIFFMLVLVVALYLAWNAVLILFLAIVISSAFNGPVSFLEKRKIPRAIGTLFIFLAVLSVLVIILYTIIPVMIDELRDLSKSINQANIPSLGAINIQGLILNIEKNIGGLAEPVYSGGMGFLDFVARIFGNLILTITTIILSFYLTVNREGVEKFLRAILPITHEEQVISVYHRVRKKLGLWLQGQILLMLIIGVSVFLGLWILGVKYSLALGILAGLLEIVPIAGPILTGIIVFLLSISQSWILALYTVILFVVIQQLENHFLVPIIMKKTTGISPVVVVIAILAGSQMAGIVGIILAVPVAVILEELLEDWERRKLRVKSGRLEI